MRYTNGLALVLFTKSPRRGLLGNCRELADEKRAGDPGSLLHVSELPRLVAGSKNRAFTSCAGLLVRVMMLLPLWAWCPSGKGKVGKEGRAPSYWLSSYSIYVARSRVTNLFTPGDTPRIEDVGLPF